MITSHRIFFHPASPQTHTNNTGVQNAHVAMSLFGRVILSQWHSRRTSKWLNSEVISFERFVLTWNKSRTHQLPRFRQALHRCNVLFSFLFRWVLPNARWLSKYQTRKMPQQPAPCTHRRPRRRKLWHSSPLLSQVFSVISKRRKFFAKIRTDLSFSPWNTTTFGKCTNPTWPAFGLQKKSTWHPTQRTGKASHPMSDTSSRMFLPFLLQGALLLRCFLWASWKFYVCVVYVWRIPLSRWRVSFVRFLRVRVYSSVAAWLTELNIFETQICN